MVSAGLVEHDSNDDLNEPETPRAGRLLVVSVSASARILYQMEFEDQGYEVFVLEGLHEPVVGLSSSIDVILYDPGPKLQACDRELAVLRRLWRGVPILLYSACDYLTARSLPQTPDVYLMRSSDLTPLISVVNQLRMLRLHKPESDSPCAEAIL